MTDPSTRGWFLLLATSVCLAHRQNGRKVHISIESSVHRVRFNKNASHFTILKKYNGSSLSMKNCTNCKKSKEDECFIGRGERPCKTCDRCRGYVLKYINKNRCEHDSQIAHCKVCSDPIEVTARRMMRSAKQADKLYNRFFDLTYDHVRQILTDTTNCPYCNTTLQYMNRAPDLASLERIDNTKGHTDENTIICCYKCNCKKVSNTVVTG